MSVTVSLAADVIGYLVAQCQASTSLGAASPSVLVFDGPQVSDSQLDARSSKVWIGYDPMSPGASVAQAEQDFAGLDMGLKRNESGWVMCAAEDASGDVAMAGHRTAVKALIGTVELLLRGVPNSGGPGDSSMGGLVLWSQVTGPFTWYQAQSQAGASAMCVFRVAYRARLLSS